MAPLLLTALLALSATTVFSQVTDQITWAAVTYTYHGEKVPDLHSGPYDLTPLGANQLYNTGQIIRQRYITPPSNGSQLTTSVPINGLSVNNIENSQLYILGTDDEFVSASAMAFMQGLYPPRSGIVIDEESILGNNSLSQFPLNGYQYPNIATVSSLDFNYLWVAGNIGCTSYEISNVKAISTPAYVQQMQSTSDFYKSLNSTVFDDLTSDVLNYANAYELYEYALYKYTHNQSIFNSQDFTTDDLDRLYYLASESEWEFNTPDGNNTINSVAGQTLASKVLQQLSHTIASSGVSDKLTLLFGSYEPFLAFFSLSNLATGPSAARFNSLPLHGSVMTFELFSYGTASPNQNLSTPFPWEGDLHVRFLFRNGTDETAPLISYPLFGRGNSEVDMAWADFVKGMGGFSLDDISDWCSSCNSITLFCEAIDENTSNGNSSSGVSQGSKGKSLSPAIGGVIGATVAIAGFIIVAAALLLAGFRIEHRQKDQPAGDLGILKRSGSGNGGFKGSERLASDTDLRLKSGAGATVIRHERVGSWELNESPNGDNKHSSLDKQLESGRVVSRADYGRRSEDDIGHENPFGDPVKPLDQV